MAENKESNAMQMYKVAFERLQFQDDYIFKFSALFLTLNGAIGLAWIKAIAGPLAKEIYLFPLAIFGFLICIVWFLWIKHNDYWHTIWIGCLRRIENEIINQNTNIRLFTCDFEKTALEGKRSKRLYFRGHSIAMSLPLISAIGWIYIAIISINC